MPPSDERKSHRCIDCGARSPETETNYTLIGSQHGWRLTRRTTRDGQLILEWRCPNCWAKHKQHAKPPPRARLDSLPPDDPPGTPRKKA